ncbi:MAG: DMT family transporter [Planctomycetes bacterium]|nr:DMT family transporter [Planctomycetota bacterium]
MTGTARYLPHLLLVLLIMIWSGSFAVSKVGLDRLSPFGLVTVRFWIAAVCVAPFVLRAGALAQFRLALWPGLLAGAALSSGYLLQMVGMTETSAAMGGLLAGLMVPIVAVGGFLFLGARFGGAGLAGLLLAIAGMVAICWPSDGPADGPKDTLFGILLQVGSSASYATHVLLLSRFGQRMPIAAFTFVQMVVVASAATIAMLVSGRFAATADGIVVWNGSLLATLAYLGILSTAIAIGIQARVQHRIPPAHVALLFTLQPLFAALCGWLALGDHLGTLQVLGGGLIVAGVVVTSLERTTSRGGQ